MAEHLWPLLRLEADSDDALKEKYRQIYLQTYVKDAEGNPVVIHDWSGNVVHFNHRSFEHAFSESTNYRTSAGIHDIPFSKRRARYMLWIKEVLSGSKGTIERLHQIRKDSRGRTIRRRVLLVLEERYVVVLQERPNPGELEFITAFQADVSYMKKLREESVRVETKKPQS